MKPPLPTPRSAGIDYRFAGGELLVDLGALKANYRELSRLSEPAVAAAVVKADAYGLGVERIVPALLEAGCRRFFTAYPYEGEHVRQSAPDADIFVLGGLFSGEVAPFYTRHGLIPVLNTAREVSIWEAHCGSTGARHPCAIHVDTGMNRLGLSATEALALARENRLTRALHIVCVMSHLACADQPDHPMNARQREAFQGLATAFGEVESSLANAAGILLGEPFLFDMTRAGIALYGVAGGPASSGLRPVAQLQGRVIQVRGAEAGETVSYGATMTLARWSRLAVVATGYADGYPRAGSGSGVPLRRDGSGGAHGFVAGQRVPTIGRITMDLTVFDVTDCGPDAVQPGDMIELFGPNIPLEEVASAAGTIAYEILTGLGGRFYRRYQDAR